MAETAYSRYLKDQKEQEEVAKTTTPSGEIRTVDDAKKVLLKAIEEGTEPKKPVGWIRPFYEDKDKSIERLAISLSPTVRYSVELEGVLKGKGLGSFEELMKKMESKDEKDYISILDEIRKGVEIGIYNLNSGLGTLLFGGTDLIANTDFLTDFEEVMQKREPSEPETWRGDLTSLLVQYGAPGTVISKVLNRTKFGAKIAKIKADRTTSKASKIAARAVEGATIVGVTDFLASEKGRQSLFFQPEDTKGLTGRKKAGAELLNKIKYGAEGSIVGGGFPIIGKATQIGYKYSLGPFVKTTAKLGAKAIDKTIAQPVSYILSREAVKPAVTAVSKGIRNVTGFALEKVLAPAIVSAMARKNAFKQLPPFEQWRLKSVVSPNKIEKNVKKLDNFMSWLRSYGKLPKDIEGVSEQAALYIKGRARKIDRTYEAIEKKSYNLAKQFQNQYNQGTTSNPLQKSYLNQVEEFLLDQRKISDLPKEFRDLAFDLKNEIKNIAKEFKKSLPDVKTADRYAKELIKTEINDIKKYFVRSFQTFTNENYVPAKEIVKDASDYIIKNIIKRSSTLKKIAREAEPKLKPEEAYAKLAEMNVSEILRIGRAEARNPIVALREIGTKILREDKYKFLKTGEELPVVIQNLLGKEKNLKSSILYTTSEMIANMANKRAADYIAQSGLKNGWLFRNYEEALAKGFTNAQKIIKIPKLGVMNSELNNLYASPEYVQMFQGVAGPLDKLMQSALYRFLIGAKSGIQMGKTLYSPQTQVRNVTSASFFSLMNGHIGHRASVTDSMKIVLDDIFKAGQKNIDEVKFNDYVEKLVRLGVWDENVVASELKAVMDAIKKNQINTTDKLMERLFKMAPTDKVAKLYAGGDNLWKHYGYEFSKSQLSSALKNIDDVAGWWKHMTGRNFDRVNTITGATKTFDDALDEAAAYLLRDTYPTYSKVPPFIQALRLLPLGNFVSFPAEILRTTTNIMNIGLRESSHSNPAIRQMGIRRLTGALMTSYAIGKGITELSQVLTNTTSSQWDAYKRSGAAPWDKLSNLIALSGWKNGESSAINYSYFSPYDSLFRPMEAAIAMAGKQKLNPKQTEDFVLGLMFSENGPVFQYLAPFVSEPLGYDRFLDVTLRNGKTKKGGSIFTESDDLTARFYKSFSHVLDGVQPGVTVSLGKISGALSKDLSGGGKPLNLRDELLALFAGVRIIKVDVKKDLTYFAATTNRLLRAVDEKEDFYTSKGFVQKTPSDLVSKFEQMQDEAMQIQKDMYIRIKDLQLLDLSESKIYSILIESGLNKQLAGNLIEGRFTPINYSKPRFERKIKEVKASLSKRSEDSDLYNFYSNRSYLFPQNELDKVKNRYNGKKFFEEKYNLETQKFEGGYNPEKEDYRLDKQGNLMFDERGNPIPERGFIGKTIEKGIGVLKDLPRRFLTPGQDLYGSKIQTPPLPIQPSPNQQVVQTMPTISQTGLTPTEQGLLSEEEKAIRLKQRGLA